MVLSSPCLLIDKHVNRMDWYQTTLDDSVRKAGLAVNLNVVGGRVAGIHRAITMAGIMVDPGRMRPYWWILT